MSVKKTSALVCALRKMHNFCIDIKSIDIKSYMDIPMSTPADGWGIKMDGGVPLVPAPGAKSSSDVIPDQLLDGGNHFDNLEY